MRQAIIALKIDSYTSFSDCAKILRQFQDFSFAELKERMDNHEYVLCYDCASDSGVKNIISCHDMLTTLGIKVSLYELDDRPTTIELVRKRDLMYDTISKEIDEE